MVIKYMRIWRCFLNHPKFVLNESLSSTSSSVCDSPIHSWVSCRPIYSSDMQADERMYFFERSGKNAYRFCPKKQ